MLKFAIKNAYYGGKTIGYLYYDEHREEYEIEVPKTVKSYEAPPIISDFIKKSQYRVGKEWSYRWVSQRVTPPERQNIGQILKANQMTEYDAFQFLVKNEGRSCQDECYIEKVEG
ncbi:hypothetical protein FMM75_17480 [Lachnospiraceae bacterium MD335]|nr:hypothetical protein [Lachnospiraceae bacterium MD335]